jgi:hypothetical protein
LIIFCNVSKWKGDNCSENDPPLSGKKRREGIG